MLRFLARKAFLSASDLLPSMSSFWACTIFCYVSMYITILVSSCLIICKSWVWMVYLFSIDDSSCTQQNSWPSKKENACKEQGTQRQDIVVVFFPCNDPLNYRCAAEILEVWFWKSSLSWCVMKSSRELCCNIFTWFHVDSFHLYSYGCWMVSSCCSVLAREPTSLHVHPIKYL